MPVALTFVLAGCGAGSSATGGGAEGPSSATGATVVIVRTGGIAGVRDTVKITADGSASVTTKNGRGRPCEPSEQALTRLRATDLAAVAAAPRTVPPIADGFSYAVRVGDQRASASEGDKDSRRADVVKAAAALLTSCLAGQPAPAGY
jgi:hypothetical protein